jgi:hypothetical protein
METARLFNEAERVAENASVPLPNALKVIWATIQTHAGALDYIFDYKTYDKLIRRHLKPEFAKKMDDKIIHSLMSTNGLNNEITFRLNMLRFLAHNFGEKSSTPGAYVFREFSWNWYRRNYVSKKTRSDAVNTTEQEQRDEIKQFLKQKNIGEGDYDTILQEFKELKREIREKQLIRENAVRALLKNARPESRKIMQALTFFAGQTLSVNEELHVLSMRIPNLVNIAAEERGIGKEELWKAIQQAAAG